MCAQLSKHKVPLSLREGAGQGGDVMCSQTMMSSVETLQGFKVTKAFSPLTGSHGALHQGFGGEMQPGTPGTVISSQGENKKD